MSLNMLSGAAFAAAVLCLLFLELNHSLFGAGPVTIAIQIAAAALMLWARLTFGLRSFHATAAATEGGLVTSGPYRFIRHPIYASILYFISAAFAAHVSAGNAAAVGVATAMLAIRMAAEEKSLRRTYPEYGEYARNTARVIPFIL